MTVRYFAVEIGVFVKMSLLNQYTQKELLDICEGMNSVSDLFYLGAIRTNCHPFIEFTGLMNEYIKISRQAAGAGIDFTQAVPLPMQDFEALYLAKKLNCILGPALGTMKPALRKAFLTKLIDG